MVRIDDIGNGEQIVEKTVDKWGRINGLMKYAGQRAKVILLGKTGVRK